MKFFNSKKESVRFGSLKRFIYYYVQMLNFFFFVFFSSKKTDRTLVNLIDAEEVFANIRQMFTITDEC